MSISFPRKILLFIIEIGLQVLWLIDEATNFDWQDVVRVGKKTFIYGAPVFSVLFFGYAFYTGYLGKVAEGLFPANVPKTNVQVVSYPIVVRAIPQPIITAKSALAIEKNKGKVLFEKSSALKMPPASTVKLMTALVALDLYSPEKELTVPKECTQIEGTKAWFPEKSKFKVKDLVYSMLVGSAGDSACVLALGDITNGEFVDLMNKKASKIGMTATRFSNPIGLDNVNGGHYTTAADLYKLASFAVGVPFIENAVKTKSYVLISVDKTFATTIYATNKFLWEVPGTIGIKTGTTTDAGEVLIYEYKDDSKDIIVVVMGSENRFNDTKVILDWILSSYSWK